MRGYSTTTSGKEERSGRSSLLTKALYAALTAASLAGVGGIVVAQEHDTGGRPHAASRVSPTTSRKPDAERLGRAPALQPSVPSFSRSATADGTVYLVGSKARADAVQHGVDEAAAMPGAPSVPIEIMSAATPQEEAVVRQAVDALNQIRGARGLRDLVVADLRAAE
jgi:hypothetical protein